MLPSQFKVPSSRLTPAQRISLQWILAKCGYSKKEITEYMGGSIREIVAPTLPNAKQLRIDLNCALLGIKVDGDSWSCLPGSNLFIAIQQAIIVGTEGLPAFEKLDALTTSAGVASTICSTAIKGGSIGFSVAAGFSHLFWVVRFDSRKEDYAAAQLRAEATFWQIIGREPTLRSSF